MSTILDQAGLNDAVGSARNHELVPFVGAGMSVPFGFKTWTQLLIEDARRWSCLTKAQNLLKKGQFEAAADLISLNSAGNFDRELANTFMSATIDPDRPSTPVLYLPRLFRGLVLTTNFDDVLEKVYEKENARFEPNNIVYGNEDPGGLLEFLNHSSHALVKLHGKPYGTTRVLTTAEYTSAYGYGEGNSKHWNTALARFIIEMFSRHSILFLGCSLTKDGYLHLLQSNASRERKPRHYAIVPSPRTSRALRNRSDDLRYYGIEPIWYDPDCHEQVGAILSEFDRRLTPPAPSMCQMDCALGEGTTIDLREEIKRFLEAGSAESTPLRKSDFDVRRNQPCPWPANSHFHVRGNGEALFCSWHPPSSNKCVEQCIRPGQIEVGLQFGPRGAGARPLYDVRLSAQDNFYIVRLRVAKHRKTSDSVPDVDIFIRINCIPTQE